MSIKVLMADDEPEVLGIMAKKIGAQGYEVVKAKDGLEAWEKIQTESPDVILLDINMPRMDGLEVLKTLRDRPSQKKWQPVIIISTRGGLEDVQKGLSLEAEHYIVKPCSIEDILKAVELVIKLIPLHKPSLECEGDNV